MNLDFDNNYVLIFAVVNYGVGSKVLTEAKTVGATGATIFLGKGTVKNNFLEFLGLNEVKKEIVLIGATKDMDEKIHHHLTEKFHMDKPNHGIIFSVDLKKIIGSGRRHESNLDSIKGGRSDMEYEVIWTVVERGLGQEVVDVATAAGAKGATIINARGAGLHENNTFFAMHIEPEKEIVMIIIKKEKGEDIVNAINQAMDIDAPGKGVLFVMDVNRTSGLVQEDDVK